MTSFYDTYGHSALLCSSPPRGFVDPLAPEGQEGMFRVFRYSDHIVPERYRCGSCGLHGVKLWRAYGLFADRLPILCRACTLKETGLTEESLSDRYKKFLKQTDTISWYCPAIPTEDGTGFWGYMAATCASILWWYRLGGRGRSGTYTGHCDEVEVVIERMLRVRELSEEDLAAIEDAARYVARLKEA